MVQSRRDIRDPRGNRARLAPPPVNNEEPVLSEEDRELRRITNGHATPEIPVAGMGVPGDIFGTLHNVFNATVNTPGFHGLGGTLSRDSTNGHVYLTPPAVGNVRPQRVDITARTTEALQFFMSPEGGGYTAAQAQGLVANLIAESGLRTDLPGDGGRALGIAQWHPDRRARFAQCCRDMGLNGDFNNFRNQLAFVTWELAHNEAAAGRDLRRQTTAEGAATSLVYNYERPLNKARDAANRSGIALGLNAEATRVAQLRTVGGVPETVAQQTPSPGPRRDTTPPAAAPVT